MADVTCPVCKEKNIEIAGAFSSVYSDRPYKVASCKRCTHMFVLDPPGADILDDLYKTVYNYEILSAIEKEKIWRLVKIDAAIKKFIPLKARIIDVGCMAGANMEALRKMGYSNLSGIEMNSSAAQKCRENGFGVFEGTFSQWLIFNSEKRDEGPASILLSHVVEHIQNLDRFLDEIYNILKPEGSLIIITPNARARTAILFGRYWGWWSVPIHLHHFSKESIFKLLTAKKFKVESAFTRGGDSLFCLSTLSSILRIKSTSHSISRLQNFFIKFFSLIFRYWLFFGDEELIVIARALQPTSP